MSKNSHSLRRSVLFVPCTNNKALYKAKSLNADAFIFDLEASVADVNKSLARNQLQQALEESFPRKQEKIVRINALGTPYFSDDLDFLKDLPVDGVLLPLINSVREVSHFAECLSKSNLNELKIWLMIETPLAILNCQQIAAMKEKLPMIEAFVFGPNDLALATGVQQVEGRQTMLSWISSCILASKAYGLDFLDAIYTDIHNHSGLMAECLQGYQMGAVGKTLIHPSHLEICNDAFSPTIEAIEFSQQVVSAYEQRDDNGVIKLQGKMIEDLHLKIAQETLRKVELISKKSLQNND